MNVGVGIRITALGSFVAHVFYKPKYYFAGCNTGRMSIKQWLAFGSSIYNLSIERKIKNNGLHWL